MNAILALILVGVLWVAVARVLERSLHSEDAEVAPVAPRQPVFRSWAQIPTNCRLGAFPDSLTAQPHTGT